MEPKVPRAQGCNLALISGKLRKAASALKKSPICAYLMTQMLTVATRVSRSLF